MKTKSILFLTLALIAALSLLCPHPAPAADWSGVDETVVEKVAEEAGREAEDPLINTDQGDLLLFVFLLAGAAGGFVGGYYFHKLFVSTPRSQEDAS